MEILDCIGNTPLIRLPKDFTQTEATVLVKLEEYNLGGSIKARVGNQMIIDAELDGRIDINHPETVTILEATGGNTGIGIAQICAIRGYHCVLTVPDNYSQVRIDLLRNMGADVILSDHKTGNDSHIRMANELLDEHPDYIYVDQTKNPSNRRAHYFGTGREILRQCGSQIDCFVAGIGSGGTITGAGRAIKEIYPSCKIVGVQPAGCDVLKGKSIPHIIQGMAIGKIPEVLDVSIVNEMISVTNEEVTDVKSQISKKLGLYLGYSSVANIIGAIRAARNMNKGKIVVTVSPDGGRNYEVKKID
jgi:cysteine synthase A